MYRDKLVDNGNDQDAPSRPPPPGKGHSSTKPHKPTPTSGSTKDGGLLGPILGLLHGLGLLLDLQFGASISYPTPTTSHSDFQPITTISFSPQTFNNPQPVPTATGVNSVFNIRSSNNKEQVGFIGIFFR